MLHVDKSPGFYLMASCASFLWSFQTGVNCPKAMSLPLDENMSALLKYVNTMLSSTEVIIKLEHILNYNKPLFQCRQNSCLKLGLGAYTVIV